MDAPTNRRPLIAAGLLLGVGLGGFIDGIVLHQIAHWHQMLSAVVPPDSMQAMQRNMVADGWFHLATWIITLVGVLILRSAVRGAGPIPTARGFIAYMLIGWGTFNLVEGIVDHHILGLHHVKEGAANPLLWDVGFLALGMALVLIGVALARPPGRQTASARSVRRAA